LPPRHDGDLRADRVPVAGHGANEEPVCAGRWRVVAKHADPGEASLHQIEIAITVDVAEGQPVTYLVPRCERSGRSAHIGKAHSRIVAKQQVFSA